MPTGSTVVSLAVQLAAAVCVVGCLLAALWPLPPSLEWKPAGVDIKPHGAPVSPAPDSVDECDEPALLAWMQFHGAYIHPALVIRSGGVGGGRGVCTAVDETAILLHPLLPLVGISIVMERERQQLDSLADG